MRIFTSLLLAVAILSGFPRVGSADHHEEKAPDNQLTEKEKKEGWILLFNGKNYKGWKNNNGTEIKSGVEDGAMQPFKSGGYVVIYEKPFADFVLKCDVKMSKAPCNSGVFVRIGDPKDPVYTGLEMQVHTGEGTGMHDFGAIYDLVPPSKNASKGAGEWNAVEIRCEGPHVAVKVNGQEVAKMNMDDFAEPGKRPDGTEHKFRRAIKEFPRKGFLGFQDHGQPVWVKNVKLLDLSKKSDKAS